jgi:hypothetical protein
LQDIEPYTLEQTWGLYKNISYSINHPHKFYKWTYYIYLNLDFFEDKKLSKSLWLKAEKLDDRYETKVYRVYKNKLINNLKFHGGCTWYSKEYRNDDNRMIKIGCDYDHLCDERVYYGLESIISDVKETIDDLHDKYVYGRAKSEPLRETTISKS